MITTEDNFHEVLDRVASDVIRAEAAKVDRGGAFPEKSISALRSAGLMGTVSSPDVGGLGLGFRGAVDLVERVGRECGSTAMVMCMHFSGTALLEALGSEDVRRAAAGEHLSTLAFSESGSRSHFWVPTGSAEALDDGHIELSAEKSWVTSSTRATAYIWSSPPVEAEGMSTLWLVGSRSEGLTVAGPFDGLGLRGNDSSPVSAKKVRVAASAMLGRDGAGFDAMLQLVLPMFSVCNAAVSVGLMRGAAERTIGHVVSTRYAHLDSSLADLPTIRNYLARMQVKTDSARALLGDAVAALESGRPDATLRVLESKAGAGETATEVLDLAMRVCGGAAFRKEVGVERYFRDARAAGIMGPTTDVLYDFIGKAVCGMELF